ncbi:hypothetical protein B0F90DRAFT_1624008 [Multifurca ochricompacta]|uniref:Uncharacterized protein n=1 Tax=Multifurca ochricompacta TaxID=376703 RepID=A0AAD4M9B7_9AGAM|nr:hypothetical protein B0F90DRAFT_1624008 [Multifurca ochricompacta]
MTDYRRLCQTLPNPSGSGVIFVVQQVPHPLQPLLLDPNGHPLWLLDYSITHTGTVVPQVLWSPQNVNDRKQHVVLADLQMPIFFTLQTGNLGISLDDAANNRCQNLCDFRSQAQLGGKTTTYVRIGVGSSRTFKRQIQIKDETENRNPITIGKFAQHLGRSVDAFLQVNPGRINRTNIKLIGAIHVSAGCWMPILQLDLYVF